MGAAESRSRAVRQTNVLEFFAFEKRALGLAVEGEVAVAAKAEGRAACVRENAIGLVMRGRRVHAC